MRESVILTQICTKKPDGRKYTHWVLRWCDSRGRWRSKSVGRIGKISKRKVAKLRKQKQIELETNPGRRNSSGTPTLGEFLELYAQTRKSELTSGTLELHRQTGRYLLGFLGESRRIESVQRADARAFKTPLANWDLAFVQKRKRRLTEATVNLHIRNARRIFCMALVVHLRNNAG